MNLIFSLIFMACTGVVYSAVLRQNTVRDFSRHLRHKRSSLDTVVAREAELPWRQESDVWLGDFENTAQDMMASTKHHLIHVT